MKFLFISILFFILNSNSFGQDTIVITYNKAINIALNESYSIKSHSENKKAMQSYFMYHKAQFKPRLDFDFFAPKWSESVYQVNLAEGLPVFNSNGSLQVGGNLNFKYILPSGGNLSLYSTTYQEKLTTALSSQDYTKLTTDQFYTKVGIGFKQPIFTKNSLRENLIEAKYLYKKSTNYYTKNQMDIIYNVTLGFYSLYKQTRMVEINRQKLKNSEQAYRIAQLKLKAKQIAEAEVYISELEMENDKATLSESLSYLKKEKNAFKQQIGLKLKENIKILAEVQWTNIVLNINKAIEEAKKSRLEINDAEIDIKLKEIEWDRAKREREFKGEISAYYELTGLGEESGANTIDLVKQSFKNMTKRPPNRGVSLTFSYPILDWGRGKAKKQQSQADIANAKLYLDDLRITIEREVIDVIRTVEESRNRLEIHKRNQILALKSYEISELRFKNGDISSQNLSREQERLSDVQLSFLKVFITYKLAVADLRRKTMWDFENDCSYMINSENNL